MEIITRYFPELDAKQQERFAKLYDLYSYWNERINVVSRKDIDQLYERHVLHSMGIAKVIAFNAGTRVIDVGTGGGFPGIPLAIMFPEVQFHLVDSIGKKITVVKAVAEALDLKNIKAEQLRAEQSKHHYDYMITRAVAPMSTLVQWVRGKIIKKSSNALPNGILALKGGQLGEELGSYGATIYNLSDFFSEEFFETKKVVFLPVSEFKR